MSFVTTLIGQSVGEDGVQHRTKHALRIFDAHGELIEKVVFRGFEDSELDDAIDCYVLACGTGQVTGAGETSAVWRQLYYREVIRE